MMKIFFLAMVLFWISSGPARAQSCGSCGQETRITQFDFDIQVPRPNAVNGTENLWPEWKNLFMLAASVSGELRQSSGTCIRITKAPSFDTGAVQEISVGGERGANLPSNPMISGDLSQYGDYLLTGVMTFEGGNCRLLAEIQASCSRKRVTAAEISFPLAAAGSDLPGLARQVAARLSAAEAIKRFQQEERAADPSLSLYQTSPGAPIKITPAKKKLKAGESTAFTIELRDCDGRPLVGREVRFTGTDFRGFGVQATIGGTVQPERVVTDAEGKARAVFTLKSGAAKALIAAYSPGKDVTGCESMFSGDALLNFDYTHSGYIWYEADFTSDCRNEEAGACSRTVASGSSHTKVQYRARFYTVAEKGEEVTVVLSEDEEELVPSKLDEGAYGSDESDLQQVISTCEGVGQGHTTTRYHMIHRGGKLKAAEVEVGFRGEGGFVELELSFSAISSYKGNLDGVGGGNFTEQEEISWPVTLNSMEDDGLSLKKIKEERGTRYMLQGSRVHNMPCGSRVETIAVMLLEE